MHNNKFRKLHSKGLKAKPAVTSGRGGKSKAPPCKYHNYGGFYGKKDYRGSEVTPGPPVGSTLGPHGINIPGFTKEFNAKTAQQEGLIIPVVITIYQDRSFTFVLKTPPAPVLIKKACGLETASAVPNKNKVGKLTKAQVEEIAKVKLPDLNCTSLESAMSMIKGTARSMGITVEE